MNPSFITSPVLQKDSELVFSSKLLPRNTAMKMKLGTKSIWQGLVHMEDMVLTSKELFLKLAVPKK